MKSPEFLLDNNDAVVEVDSVHGDCVEVYRQGSICMEGIYIVDEIFGELDERVRVFQAAFPVRPVRRMTIFAHIESAVLDMREHLLKGHDLLLHSVTAVVQQYVDTRVFCLEVIPEIDVSLIADLYGDLFVLKLFTIRIDVHADNFCVLPEVIFPHLNRAAVLDSDLKEDYIVTTPPPIFL